MAFSTDESPRLVRVVFASHRPYFDTLRKASNLRLHDRLESVFIRRSMIESKRSKYKELRAEAIRINQMESQGENVYVVYRDTVIKSTDSPAFKASFQKKLDSQFQN